MFNFYSIGLKNIATDTTAYFFKQSLYPKTPTPKTIFLKTSTYILRKITAFGATISPKGKHIKPNTAFYLPVA